MKISFIRKFLLVSTSVFALHYLFVFATVNISSTKLTEETVLANDPPVVNQFSLYDSLSLGELGLTKQAFEYAMNGFHSLVAAGKVKNMDVLSIADFSMGSSKKRLFIIDMKQQKLLFHTYVSHGRNSGLEKASQFSNEDGSFKSSIGFYTTQNTYEGKHGYSLRLNGEEKGFNDKALSRGIVMHSAAYVNESIVRRQGYIGRSLGCPAVSEELHKSIISKIKSGSCFFIYSPDKFYAAKSTLIRQLA